LRLPSAIALPLLTAAAATGLYGGFTQAVGVPAASSLVGHALGIIGFAMMLMTETLYSLRKRAMHRPRGSMRSWLVFHIFTGIVGSWLVVLHAAGSFRGLAGVLTVMTAVVVASGFIGRYIYTAVPRTADGVEIEAQELQLLLEAARIGAAGSAATRTATRRLRELERQMGALRWARRAMATWHAVHVPLGMALFVIAFTHIGAAVYYATLLR
jgi:hypothetical protein